MADSGTVRSRISRAKQKAQEFSLDKLLETVADLEAKRRYPHESAPKTTVYRHRSQFRTQFLEAMNNNNITTYDPQTGKVVTICGIPAEHFKTFSKEQQMQMIENSWHAQAMQGMERTHSTWVLSRSQNPATILSILQQMQPNSHPYGNGIAAPPMALQAPMGRPPNALQQIHHGNNGLAIGPPDVPPNPTSGVLSAALQQQMHPDGSSVPPNNGNGSSAAAPPSNVPANENPTTAVLSAALPQMHIGPPTEQTNAPPTVPPTNVPPNGSSAPILDGGDNNNNNNGRISPNENLLPPTQQQQQQAPKTPRPKKTAQATKTPRPKTVAQEFVSAGTQGGPNDIAIEQLSKRTGITPAPQRHKAPPLQESENITRIDTPARGGSSKEDVIVLESDSEDEELAMEQATAVEPVYKCCAGDECVLFKNDFLRDVSKSTHHCVDCLGIVHTPGQTDIFKEPCCLALEGDPSLWRKVKRNLEKPVSAVGCLCRLCYLKHYKKMESPPPSPAVEEKQPVWSCAICLDFFGEEALDSKDPLKEHPQIDAIVQAVHDINDVRLTEEDLEDRLCRSCAASLLGDNYQAPSIQDSSATKTETDARTGNEEGPTKTETDARTGNEEGPTETETNARTGNEEGPTETEADTPVVVQHSSRPSSWSSSSWRSGLVFASSS